MQKSRWKTRRLERLIKSLNQVEKMEVAVGVVRRERRNGTATQAAIYKHLDQGDVGKKEKKWPTLEPALREANYQGRIRGIVQDASRGFGVAGLHRIGSVASLKVKSNIRSIKTPTLEPSTIKMKGSSNPLIETSGLLKSINYQIQRKTR